MKFVLAALNAKYVHSNLAIYDIEAYATEQLNKERMNSGQRNESGESREIEQFPQLVVREYTINQNLDAILQSLYLEKADVVAFSCYIWNIAEIYTVARELKKVAPHTKIWLGGPEVSYHSRQVLQECDFVELVMCGEGEETFYELIKCQLNGRPYGTVKGISYRDDANRVVANEVRPPMDLSNVPFIYSDLSRFENRVIYYESSRGCPFSCSYCLSSIDKSVRFRDLEMVKKELQFFLDKEVPQVKFVDRTFNCNKQHALTIWNYLLEHDNGVSNFHFEVAADLLGEEELKVLQRMRPGLIQLEIGLQTTNPQTLEAIQRKTDLEKLQSNMKQIRSFSNIHQHLDLIAGLPYEDLTSFRQSFNDAYAMKPDQLQLGFLKVLKGSLMEANVWQYELQYQNTQPFEVLTTKWISYDEILQLKQVEEMVEVYYNSNQFRHVLAYVVPEFESPYAFYQALGDFYKERQLFGIGFKREARYIALKEFCEEWFKDLATDFSSEVLLSLLSYDYYLREHAKTRPAWALKKPIDKKAYQQFFINGGTQLFTFDREGYDSKVAARSMHIETVCPEALCWILEEEEENVLSDFCQSASSLWYCLFDYQQRNPLTKDAKVVLLPYL